MRIALFLIPLALLTAQADRPAIDKEKIDNELVHVVYANDQPVSKPGALHEHKQNRVMIYLDGGDMRIAYADGHVDNQHWKAGDIAWSPGGGMHTSQNVGSKPVRIVELELRNGPAGGDTKPGAYKTIDNAQVHVYRASKPPAAGKHYVAVDTRAGVALYDKMPTGAGPFVIAELK